MPKRESKTAIIHDYLANNPTATWKVAKGDLEKHGITSNYFSMQKGKWKQGGSSKAARASSKGKTKRTAAVGRPATRNKGDEGLGQAVAFARSVGGISSAQELLNQLAKVQVGGESR